MTSEDVTIILPIYCTTVDHVMWLDECLHSAEIQDCKVIAWDDASKISIEPAIKRYPGVLIGRNETNKGVSVTRNLLASQVKTPLLFPLDCDDMLVPGAVERIARYWNGTPLYSDVEMFGARVIPHYNLKDFSCDELSRNVSLASVCVLHSTKQWKSIGGWDERLILFEDGEYNARLMAEYCGQRIPFPLVRYRQHSSQRTQLHKDDGRQIARDVNAIIRSEVMGKSCCGRGNSSKQTVGGVQMSQGSDKPVFYNRVGLGQTAVLPGSDEDRVLAKYIGGAGRGVHYYKGRHTGFRYKVEFGAVIMADKRDTVAHESQAQYGLLVAMAPVVEKKEEKPVAPKFFRPVEEKLAITQSPASPVVEEEIADIEDEVSGVVVDDDEEITTGYRVIDDDWMEAWDDEAGEFYQVPNISNMNLHQLRTFGDLSDWEAEQLLMIEKAEKNRKGHKMFLEKIING